MKPVKFEELNHAYDSSDSLGEYKESMRKFFCYYLPEGKINRQTGKVFRAIYNEARGI